MAELLGLDLADGALAEDAAAGVTAFAAEDCGSLPELKCCMQCLM